MDEPIQVTCECAPNIALIKYWGKTDQELILPLNGSISITLDTKVLNSKTTVVLLRESEVNDSDSKRIQIWFDDQKQEFNERNENFGKKEKELISKKRFLSVLNKVRGNCSLENPLSFHVRIKTTNSFPTACGLASSASGFACLAICLAEAFGYKGDVSELARLGSGSACRSCYGGFVKWTSSDKSDQSISTRLFSSEHWPDFNVLALILEDERKKVSSTHGMETSVQTSELLKHRVKLVEEERLNQMETYIKQKDFDEVGKLAIRESNSLHAVCLDTYPPLFYLNDKSKEIIRLVNEFNDFESAPSYSLKAFYSFDAGPNAWLFCRDKHLPELLYLIFKFYFSDFLNENQYSEMLIRNGSIGKVIDKIGLQRKYALDAHFEPIKHLKGKNEKTIKYIISSKIGEDPRGKKNDWENSLLNKNGIPKKI